MWCDHVIMWNEKCIVNRDRVVVWESRISDNQLGGNTERHGNELWTVTIVLSLCVESEWLKICVWTIGQCSICWILRNSLFFYLSLVGPNFTDFDCSFFLWNCVTVGVRQPSTGFIAKRCFWFRFINSNSLETWNRQSDHGDHISDAQWANWTILLSARNEPVCT